MVPMNFLKTVPNLLTASRLILAVPLALAILDERYGSALLVAALAGMTDALDGFLARRLNASTRLGAALDPVADKVMILAVFASLAAVGLLPVWLAGVVIGRDLVIVTGALAYRLLIGLLDFQPTLLSKANMALQIGFLVLMHFSAARTEWPDRPDCDPGSRQWSALCAAVDPKGSGGPPSCWRLGCSTDWMEGLHQPAIGNCGC